MVRVAEIDEERAREIIVSHDDKDYAFTDATSFAVMERLGITTAFTFDRHFAQFGFAVLGPDEPQRTATGFIPLSLLLLFRSTQGHAVSA